MALRDIFHEQTPRLILRPLGVEDGGAYLRKIKECNPNAVTNAQEQGCRLGKSAKMFDGKNRFHVGGFCRQTGELILDIGVSHSGGAEWNLGYYTMADKRRQGYMREAVVPFVNYVMEQDNISLLRANVAQDNVGSRVLLERVGFVHMPHMPCSLEWTTYLRLKM